MLFISDHGGRFYQILEEARQNGSLVKAASERGHIVSLMDNLKYLSDYRHGDDVENVHCVVRIYPRPLDAEFGIQWWFRKTDRIYGAENPECPEEILHPNAVMRMMEDERDWYRKLSEKFFPAMSGGLVYHHTSGEWSVHT